MKEVNDVKIQLQIVTQEKEHLEDMLREEAHRRAEAEAAREVLERTQVYAAAPPVVHGLGGGGGGV